MPLVTSKEMLLKAQQGGYAVGAFNAENMEMVKAIIQAAEELKACLLYTSWKNPEFGSPAGTGWMIMNIAIRKRDLYGKRKFLKKQSM